MLADQGVQLRVLLFRELALVLGGVDLLSRHARSTKRQLSGLFLTAGFGGYGSLAVLVPCRQREDMEYVDFEVRFEPPAGEGYPVAVVDAPAGQIRSPLELHASRLTPALSGLGRRIRRSAADRGGALRHFSAEDDDPQPAEIGAVLYRALVSGGLKTLLDRSRGMVFERGGAGLRIRLRFDLQDSELAELASLPWELLHDETAHRFLFRGDRRTLLVRFLEVPETAAALAGKPPFRILAVLASPRDLPPLDLAEERRRISQALVAQGRIELVFLEQARLSDLREEILRSRCQGLHFMGHGQFDSVTGKGMLALVGEDGNQLLASGATLAERLGDLGLRLVVFNACQSGQVTGETGRDPFAGLAAALVQGGLPAVVAMQFPISDQAAIRFAEIFYRRLAAGDRVDTAVGEARRALHEDDPGSLEWVTPVLYMRTPDGRIFDLAEEKETTLRERLQGRLGRGKPFEDDLLERMGRRRLGKVPMGRWLVALLSVFSQAVVWIYLGLLFQNPLAFWRSPQFAVGTFVALAAAFLALRSDRAVPSEGKLSRPIVRRLAFLLGGAVLTAAWLLLR